MKMMPPSWHPLYAPRRNRFSSLRPPECELRNSPLHPSGNATRPSYHCSNGVLDILPRLFSGRRDHAFSFFDLSDHEKDHYWREGLVDEKMLTEDSLSADKWYQAFQRVEEEKAYKRRRMEFWDMVRRDKEEMEFQRNREKEEEVEARSWWWRMLDVGSLKALLMRVLAL